MLSISPAELRAVCPVGPARPPARRQVCPTAPPPAAAKTLCRHSSHLQT